MDFSLSPDEAAASELAASVFADLCNAALLQQADQSAARFSPELWQKTCEVGLSTLSLPEPHGAGASFAACAGVLIEAGRRLAPIPLATHLAAGALLAEAEGHNELCAELSKHDVIASCAISEAGSAAPDSPQTTARVVDTGWVLVGRKTLVPAASFADVFLVTATTDAGPGVFVVRPGDQGVSIAHQKLSDGDVVGELTFDECLLAQDRVLSTSSSALVAGGESSSTAQKLTAYATLASCAYQVGAIQGALDLTASYARAREQFDAPIGSFQAVRQRLADGYIDTLGASLTLWQAVWQLQTGLDAQEAIAVTKVWSADVGHRLAHTCVHIHGGAGIDLDGDAHRYFTAAKRGEFELGSAAEHTLNLGRLIATR